MFVVKNISDRDVILDDLRVLLGPGKQIDLDKVASRHQIDSSPKLQLAFRQKRVAIVHEEVKGGDGGHKADQSAALREMEERLKAEFTRQMQQVLRAASEQSPPPEQPSADISALTQAVQALMQEIKNRPQQVIVQQVAGEAKPSVESSTGDGISDDIASRIHAKAMKRLEDKVTGHVEHEEKKIRDDSLKANIEELEGLL